MNIKLLKEIQQGILSEPTRFDIGDWIDTSSTVSNCGTTACIAGWAVVSDFANRNPGLPWKEACIQANENMRFKVDKCAIRQLQIDHDQATRLFYSDDWPEPFRTEHGELADDFEAAESKRDQAMIRTKMAKVAVRRIDHFIATNGEE